MRWKRLNSFLTAIDGLQFRSLRKSKLNCCAILFTFYEGFKNRYPGKYKCRVSTVSFTERNMKNVRKRRRPISSIFAILESHRLATNKLAKFVRSANTFAQSNNTSTALHQHVAAWPVYCRRVEIEQDICQFHWRRTALKYNRWATRLYIISYFGDKRCTRKTPAFEVRAGWRRSVLLCVLCWFKVCYFIGVAC